MVPNLKENISFINITSNESTLVDWKPPRSFKSFILDLRMVKENEVQEIYFHLDKGNMKIVYIRKGVLLLSIGALPEVQFQLLEAILELVDKQFNEMYDTEVILSYGTISENTFNPFKTKIDTLLDGFKELDVGKTVSTFCRVCKKNLPIFIKRSMIEQADSFPVPIVYHHEGHATLCYIDKNFEVRGVELVNTTG